MCDYCMFENFERRDGASASNGWNVERKEEATFFLLLFLALLRSPKEREAGAFCCPRLVLRLVIYRFGRSCFAWWKVRLCYVESPALLGGKSCFKRSESSALLFVKSSTSREYGCGLAVAKLCLKKFATTLQQLCNWFVEKYKCLKMNCLMFEKCAKLQSCKLFRKNSGYIIEKKIVEY